MNHSQGTSLPDTCSRRGFLGKSAVTTAAAALAAPRLMAADTAPKKVRIGVVGGGFGCSFQWHEHPDCIVEAVSDLRPERRQALMKAYRCEKSYESLEKLVLDPQIDAVALFTEGPNHVKHVAEAMSHGKHVISAVPAAWGTLEECELLRDTVRKYGLTYMMAETSYYQQATISARKFYQCAGQPRFRSPFVRPRGGARRWFPSSFASSAGSSDSRALMQRVTHGEVYDKSRDSLTRI